MRGCFVKDGNSGKPMWDSQVGFYSHKLLADYRHVPWFILENTFLMDLKSIVLVELKEFHGQ